MGTLKGTDSVAVQAADYLKRKYHKPGNVYVGVVSRLDAVVSGVLVLARTSKAASRISEQIRSHSTSKRYLALVEGQLEDTFRLSGGGFRDVVHYLRKNESLHRVESVGRKGDLAQEALLRLRLLKRLPSCSLVEVDLVTGRKHQIRVQLSAIGHPVLRDFKYGATTSSSISRRDARGIGLHCYHVTIEHPTRHMPMTFHAMPGHWKQMFRMREGDLCWEQLLENVKVIPPGSDLEIQ